jgi:hypothetical protein
MNDVMLDKLINNYKPAAKKGITPKPFSKTSLFSKNR